MVLAIAVALALQGWRRGALAWLAAVGGTFLVMLALKLVFLACWPVFWPMDIHSPSGHVAAATVVSGGLALLLARRRVSILPIAALAGVVIGISRLVLGVHSVPEVVMGAVIGLTGVIVLVHLAGPVPRLKVKPLVIAVVVVATVFHGLRLPAEAEIRFTAGRMARLFAVCRPERAQLPVLRQVQTASVSR